MKIRTSDVQRGWVYAMYFNGSLKIPTGSGKTIIECELCRNFERPVLVSNRKELREQFSATATRMGVSVTTCSTREYCELDFHPDAVIVCETVPDDFKPGRVKVWRNRSV